MPSDPDRSSTRDAGSDPDPTRRAALEALLAGNPQHRFAAGDRIMTEGGTAGWFAYVASGSAEVTRHSPSGDVRLGVAGPGSIIGELALITASPRTATVTATTDVVVAIGDLRDLDRVLTDPDIAADIARVVADRLARIAEPVSVTLATGHTVSLRPGLSSDGSALAAGLAAMSAESLRRRFFSGGMPPASVVRYLLDVDYVDHFAWAAIDTEDPDAPVIGSARFIRSRSDPTEADIAVGLIDRMQGRGIGRLLVEALGVAAATAGIERFTADVLRENLPMRKLLRRPSTEWTSSEPGALHAVADARDFGTTLEPDVRDRLAAVASSIIGSSAAVLL